MSLPFLRKYFVPPGFEEYREFLAACNKKLLTGAKLTSKQLNIYEVGCGEKIKFLNFEKWYLYLSPNMEQITLELILGWCTL